MDVLRRIDRVASGSLSPDDLKLYGRGLRPRLAAQLEESPTFARSLSSYRDEELQSMLTRMVAEAVARGMTADSLQAPPAEGPVADPEVAAAIANLRFTRVVTMTLVAVCVGVFVLELMLGGGQVTNGVLLRMGARANPLIARGEYWRLVAPIFLHGNMMHLVMNMIALWSVGTLAETLFGRTRYLIIFMFAGLAGTFAGFAFANPRVLSIGASGAIFGLLGSLVGFRAMAGRGALGRLINARALYETIGINLVIGLVLFFMIDNYAHIGGFIGGYLASEAVGIGGRPPLRPRNLVALAIYLAAMVWLYTIGIAR